jgi:hypothetical protein
MRVKGAGPGFWIEDKLLEQTLDLGLDRVGFKIE